MNASAEELQKALDRLENEKRGRAFGIVGPAAAVAGDWLAWITPEMRAAMTAHASKVKIEDASPACTTTYSKIDDAPKNDERPPDLSEPKPTEWHRIWVTTESPSATRPGAIEEAQFAVVGDEIILADLEGWEVSRRRLEPGEAPAVAARRMLRGKTPKRVTLLFPNVGVA
jgi:hypothetical protein